MRAILVAVEYDDLLAVTLPINKHHFSEMWVVTGDRPQDEGTRRLCCDLGVNLVVTDLFWRDGAKFNKFRALEYGYDVMGRHGWIVNLDADVVWPRDMKWREWTANPNEGCGLLLEEDWRPHHELLECSKPPIVSCFVGGNLYGPLRRMMSMEDFRSGGIPPENCWHRFPIHKNVNEIAGFSQIFHADDPHLDAPPWHGILNSHAGSEDSWFQQKWPTECKIRLPWECLHIGPAGENWMGRATPLLDGTVLPGSEERLTQNRAIWQVRRDRQRRGLDPYEPERIQPSS